MAGALYDYGCKLTYYFFIFFPKNRESYLFTGESYLFAGEINALTGELNGKISHSELNFNRRRPPKFGSTLNEKPARKRHADLNNTQRYEKSQQLPR